MKKLFVLVTCLLSSVGALADQAATITCTGKNVILTTKTPYWGDENADAAQTLYILKAINSVDESTKTAYFLNVKAENDVDKDEMILSTGKNSKGGHFLLKTKFWEDVGDGTVINQKTTGFLTYHHGTLVGKDEPVSCEKN